MRLSLLQALGPLARPLVTKRELRVAITGVSLISLAFVAALVLPLWQLALGPIIWGVLHVLADLRYLVVRPGFHRRLFTVVAVGIPLLAVAVLAEVWIGFVAAGVAILCARTTKRRRAVGVLIAGALAFASWNLGYYAALGFAHAHNFIAVMLWWLWRRRKTTLHWLPLATVALCSALLLAGVGSSIGDGIGLLDWTPSGLHLRDHLAVLAPGMSHSLGVRLVVLFAFAQTVHYIVWLRLIPEEDRERETPRTYGGTIRALQRDLGRWPTMIIAVMAAAVVVWAVADLAGARLGYLRATLFHGHLELAAIALLWAEGNRWFVSGSKRSS